MSEQENFGVIWERRPADGEMKHVWRIDRAPKKGADKYLMLCGDIIGCRTHFWGGRTTPCTYHDCKACAANNCPQWHGYIAAIRAHDNRRTILEITDGVVSIFDDAFRERRTLRGLVFEIKRTSDRANGRVCVRVLDWIKMEAADRPAPSVKKILASVWRLKEDGLLADLTLPAVSVFDPAGQAERVKEA